MSQQAVHELAESLMSLKQKIKENVPNAEILNALRFNYLLSWLNVKGHYMFEFLNVLLAVDGCSAYVHIVKFWK